MPLGALSSQVEKYCLLDSKNPIVHSSETSVNNRARPVPAVGNGFLHDKSKVHVSRSSFKRVQSPGPINATQPEWVSSPPGLALHSPRWTAQQHWAPALCWHGTQRMQPQVPGPVAVTAVGQAPGCGCWDLVAGPSLEAPRRLQQALLLTLEGAGACG